MIVAQRFMPRQVSEGLNRLLGGEHVFTDDVDMEKRRTYEARARGEE
ncbi:short-chain dehydrogenase [Mycobacterium tuberculosis]|nr:short-chain dehydrogenase [Mycobacterium tuberculosis]CKO12572.1 short-chain dehydrogenase [Mycobacterium tuberculosis]CKT73759.1 short-chain dehydrogenase [Mycobacterium tuberculosis]COW40454.1 short-chain dehydrogenase [Mycobacterium tuberculosis]